MSVLGTSSGLRLAIASIGVSVCVFGLKMAASSLTGSLALYADALESVVNIVTAVVALAAIHFAGRPPDRTHQYGHHKAEYLAAVIEGVLIVLAAAAILRAAYQAWYAPPVLALTASGVGLNVLAGVINAGWAAILIRKGRALRSPALVADGWHLVADVVSSVAVLGGLSVVALTGATWLDTVFSAAVAVYILWAGGRLLQSSMSGLMDEAAAADVAQTIRAAIADNADGALQVHDLRTRIAGPLTYIEFHLVVPGRMSVKAAHDICDRLENAIEAQIPDSRVLIHIEPEGEAHAAGALVL
jgi:cation diffusion facilitator family transporter